MVYRLELQSIAIEPYPQAPNFQYGSMQPPPPGTPTQKFYDFSVVFIPSQDQHEDPKVNVPGSNGMLALTVRIPQDGGLDAAWVKARQQVAEYVNELAQACQARP